MRMHIQKSTQSRSEKIKNAIDVYNSACRSMVPPRPEVNWPTIANYRFLSEFDLLRETSRDLRQERWTDPSIRELLRLVQQEKRAKEEIIRLNIETKRLHTFIKDEEAIISEVKARLIDTDRATFNLIQDWYAYRQRLNSKLLNKIHQVCIKYKS